MISSLVIRIKVSSARSCGCENHGCRCVAGAQVGGVEEIFSVPEENIPSLPFSCAIFCLIAVGNGENIEFS